jgi:hypothetical protein
MKLRNNTAAKSEQLYSGYDSKQLDCFQHEITTQTRQLHSVLMLKKVTYQVNRITATSKHAVTALTDSYSSHGHVHSVIKQSWKYENK